MSILNGREIQLPSFKKYLSEPKEIRFKRMETRWGSCNVKQAIVLNPELIKAPKACIEYVIVHELCHLREMNHSVRFWRLVSETVPDYKNIQNKLKKI
jgi:predicted metal-dependent hydrolase